MGIELTVQELFRKHDKDQVPSTEDALTDEELDQLASNQQDIEHELTRYEAFKRYKHIAFYVFVAVWTMVLWGYENQAGGIVFAIPQFRKDFGYEYTEGDYVLDTKWQAAISGAPIASISVASIIASWLADKIGRRRVLMFASLFSIPFITIEYLATTIEVFFVGKFMNGFALGAFSAICATYVSEVSPLALRGIFSSALALSLCIGPFICVLINNTTSTYTTRMAYRGIFIPQWIFAAISIGLQCFIPESPYWLLTKSRDKDAIKQLKRMYSTPELVKGQYALMKVTVNEAALISSKSGSYFDCFKAKDLKRTFIIVFTFLMQAMSGVSYVATYGTYYFQRAGFDTQQSFQISCGAQALSISGVITSFFIIDRFGRRPLLLGGMIALTILNLLIAVTGLFTSNASAMKTSVGFLAMYNFIYNIGIGPVPYIIGNEVSSIFLRAKTISIASFLNNAFQCMWSSVLPYMFNPDRANMGSKINFIFTGLTFLSLFVFYFQLPETAHRSFEDIDELFALGVPARKWKNYVLSRNAGGLQAQEKYQQAALHVEDARVDSESLSKEDV